MEENTLADSIAVGVPRNGEKALRAIRESGGLTVTVSDDEILGAMRLLGRVSGVFGEPAGVTGTAGLKKAVEEKRIPPEATVVSLVTGNGLKDTASARRAAGEPLQIPPDLGVLIEEFGRRGIHP
jgi:threonine synthase